MTENKDPKNSSRPGRKGGARKGAGRPKGSKTRVTTESILSRIEEVTGKDYVTIIAEQLNIAINTGDVRLVKDYLDMVGKKVIADKSETDITSGGEKLQTAFNFAPAVLPEWEDSNE
jgi:hypothetical protein